MDRFERTAALPSEMQGRWVDVEDPTVELTVRGGEVVCFGELVVYDYKLVGKIDGALTVSLRRDDEVG